MKPKTQLLFKSLKLAERKTVQFEKTLPKITERTQSQEELLAILQDREDEAYRKYEASLSEYL
jgi:hypothetical protein